MDLRSGTLKSSAVPPPRPYRRREMVVHSPVKPRQGAPDDTGTEGTVPPSVAAAAAAAAAAPASEADLLGGLDTARTEEFGTWDARPPPSSIEADVHAGEEDEEVKINRDSVHHQRRRYNTANAERISVVDGDATAPPPNTGTGAPPGLNPFTPEWFAQVIGAAATAAATAVAGAPRPSAPANSSTPRRLNERKIPDFWEDKPDFWFRIFDAHLAHFSPTERQCFDTLLPLLTPAARAAVHSVVRSPGASPYSKARDALLRHFGQTPRQQAREFRDARSMGDKLPTEFLDHLEALVPDFKVLLEVALLDALPPNARVAALQHSNVRAMAVAADEVVRENRALAAAGRDVADGVHSLSLMDSELVNPSACQTPLSPSSAVAAVSRGPPAARRESLCQNHKRWGRETYKCLAPTSCKMRSILKPRPPSASSSSASGKWKAGGQ